MYICSPNEIDKKIILTEATEMYQLKKETVVAAIGLGGALVVKTHNGILQSYVVFTMCLDEERFETRAMVIGLGYTDVYAIKMLIRKLRTSFKSVIYSLDTLNRMGLDGTDVWNYIPSNVEKYDVDFDESKVFSDSFRKILTDSRKFDREFSKLKGNRDKYIPTKCGEHQANVMNSIRSMSNVAYVANMMSKEYCSSLVDKLKEYKFTVNEGEDEYYQIPEVVIKYSNSDLFLELEYAFNNYIAKYLQTIRFKKEFNINSIQFAKYSATGEISKGNWHYDEDSDSTVVIYLNDDYEGGGTQFKTDADDNIITVDKFEVGDSIFFNGKVVPHRGLPVTKGDRYILVFWCSGLSEVFE